LTESRCHFSRRPRRQRRSTSSPFRRGVTTRQFPSLGGLYGSIARAYRLGVSLSHAPLQLFRKKAANLPRSTEAERLVVQRVGQDIFRKSLPNIGTTAARRGIGDPDLLRASHIVPWAECDDAAHRLDVYNGLLLSALWDAAFDAGKVSFTDEGEPLWPRREAANAPPLAPLSAIENLS
jgi:hypothetical protein